MQTPYVPPGSRPAMTSYADYSQTRPQPEPTEKKPKSRKEKKEKKDKRKKKKHRREDATILQTEPGTGAERIGEVMPRPSPVHSSGLNPVWDVHTAMPTPEEVAARREQELAGIYSRDPAPVTEQDMDHQHGDSGSLLRQYQNSRDRQDQELVAVSQAMAPPDETIECGLDTSTAAAGPTAMDLGKWREEELDRLAEIQHRVANGEGEQPHYYY
jgi:hypothetical protein